MSQDAGLPSQPLKWTGRELDETGLYCLRGRYYNPQLGRFLSEDPAGLVANLNLYVFTLNSPVGMRDPFGLCASSMNDGDPANYEPPLKWGDTIPQNAARHPWAGQALGGIKIGTEVAVGLIPGGGVALLANDLAEGDVAGAAMGAIPGGKIGGMLGKASTRAQDAAIADELVKLGWEITGGGGRKRQLCIPDPTVPKTGRRGRPKGTLFPDVSATKNGKTIHIQTVSTYADGWPTNDEMRNIIRLRRLRPNDDVVWIPKSK